MTGHPVQLENDVLRVTVLPEIGGKISSIVALSTGTARGTELLQPPLVPVVPRPAGLPFDRSDASGWDECLPSVSGCRLADGRQIQDHGDLWRVAWTVNQQDGHSATMTADATSLPLRMERTLRLRGSSLLLGYRVRNTGTAEVPYVWSAHPLFAVDPGDRIVLPGSVDEVRVEGSGGRRLGLAGGRVEWPGRFHLDEVPGPEANVGDKLYAAAPPEGWAALERVRAGIRLEVHFDPAILLWLGLWICYGGWPEGAAVRGYCVALEPCTAPADSLARAIDDGHARKLAPGEAHSWSIELRMLTI